MISRSSFAGWLERLAYRIKPKNPAPQPPEMHHVVIDGMAAEQYGQSIRDALAEAIKNPATPPFIGRTRHKSYAEFKADLGRGPVVLGFQQVDPPPAPAKPRRKYSIKGWTRDGGGVFQKDGVRIWRLNGDWIRQNGDDCPTKHRTLHAAIASGQSFSIEMNVQPAGPEGITLESLGLDQPGEQAEHFHSPQPNPVDVLAEAAAQIYPNHPLDLQSFEQARRIVDEHISDLARQRHAQGFGSSWQGGETAPVASRPAPIDNVGL